MLPQLPFHGRELNALYVEIARRLRGPAAVVLTVAAAALCIYVLVEFVPFAPPTRMR